jgi:16S rRNA (guanine966-N2)-methyltransferase
VTLAIIAGQYRGLKLHLPPPIVARPTAALVREALFSILADRVPGARVLDLFAGSGALGLEAFSRGAERVVFMERHIAAFKVLKANLALFPPDSPLLARLGAVPRALTGIHGQFDLILMDPPYGTTLPPLAFLNSPLSASHLAPGGLLVWELDPKTLDFFLERGFPPEWTLVDRRRWSGKACAFLERGASAGEGDGGDGGEPEISGAP